MRLQFRGWMTPAAVGVISFAAGAASGYFFKKYKDMDLLESSIEETVTDIPEIAELESQMAQLQFAFEERDRKYDVHLQQAMKVIVALQDAKKEFMESLEAGTQRVEEIQHVDTKPVTNSSGKSKQTPKKVQPKLVPNEKVEEVEGIFPVSEDEDWSYEEEIKTRGPDHPYIIHRDEFFSQESEYRQTSLSYYQSDNILCDEQDVPVYNPEKVVGELKFGHGSADPSIVYIRNDHLEAEYEVILDEGYYQTEVLGHEVENAVERNELKHGVHRFRTTD